MPPHVTGATLGELLTAGPYRPSLWGGYRPCSPPHPHISAGTIIARQSSQVSQVSGHPGEGPASAQRQQTPSTPVFPTQSLCHPLTKYQEAPTPHTRVETSRCTGSATYFSTLIFGAPSCLMKAKKKKERNVVMFPRTLPSCERGSRAKLLVQFVTCLSHFPIILSIRASQWSSHAFGK